MACVVQGKKKSERDKNKKIGDEEKKKKTTNLAKKLVLGRIDR